MVHLKRLYNILMFVGHVCRHNSQPALLKLTHHPLAGHWSPILFRLFTAGAAGFLLLIQSGYWPEPATAIGPNVDGRFGLSSSR
jgi:hypothetical protein